MATIASAILTANVDIQVLTEAFAPLRDVVVTDGANSYVSIEDGDAAQAILMELNPAGGSGADDATVDLMSVTDRVTGSELVFSKIRGFYIQLLTDDTDFTSTGIEVGGGVDPFMSVWPLGSGDFFYFTNAVGITISAANNNVLVTNTDALASARVLLILIGDI